MKVCLFVCSVSFFALCGLLFRVVCLIVCLLLRFALWPLKHGGIRREAKEGLRTEGREVLFVCEGKARFCSSVFLFCFSVSSLIC